MKIGIDTLFTTPETQGSIVDYLRNLVRLLSQIDREDQFYLLVSPKNRFLFEGVAGPNFTFVDCHVSNERPLCRILAQQVLIPYDIRRDGIQVLFSPADVAPLLAPCRLVLKVNTLHHFHTPYALGRQRTLYRRVMIGASVRRADLVVANSDYTKAEICRHFPVSPGKVDVILEAVEETFGVTEDRPSLLEHLKRTYGIERDYVLFVSSLYKYKNLSTLLRAFGLLCRDSDWSNDLVVVGPDPHGHRAEMERLAEELGITGRVRFLGFVPNPQMRELYCGALALVYPSLAETFGKPLVEAMRCQTPIVASRAGAIPEILAGSGLLVEPLDVPGTARAISQIVRDEQVRSSLVERGAQRALDFSWEAAARATVAAFHRIGNENPDA